VTQRDATTHAIELVSASAEQTREIGAGIGRRVRAGDLILLHGDLGAGKTTLAQGIARGLGVEGYVQSPTFTLVSEHEGRTADGEPIRLYHLDLYRLAGEEDLESFGFDDYLEPIDGVSLIEWPERAETRLPDAYLLIHLEHLGEDKRRLLIEPVPAAGDHAAWLGELWDELAGAG
jgi:tRNA threonylcarbamoyladenosine biosynthesis protein TsaE